MTAPARDPRLRGEADPYNTAFTNTVLTPVVYVGDVVRFAEKE
jgi:hypothetical protein